jgi:hypothetical protein
VGGAELFSCVEPMLFAAQTRVFGPNVIPPVTLGLAATPGAVVSNVLGDGGHGHVHHGAVENHHELTRRQHRQHRSRPRPHRPPLAVLS